MFFWDGRCNYKPTLNEIAKQTKCLQDSSIFRHSVFPHCLVFPLHKREGPGKFIHTKVLWIDIHVISGLKYVSETIQPNLLPNIRSTLQYPWEASIAFPPKDQLTLFPLLGSLSQNTLTSFGSKLPPSTISCYSCFDPTDYVQPFDQLSRYLQKAIVFLSGSFTNLTLVILTCLLCHGFQTTTILHLFGVS